MNNTEIILKGNKLIAEFMGLKGRVNHLNEFVTSHIDGNGHGYEENVYYHYSWDWLMPVIEKIEDTDDLEYKGFGHAFVMNNYEVNVTSLATGEIKVYMSVGLASSTIDVKSKIEVAWLACVEFINQYNKTNIQEINE